MILGLDLGTNSIGFSLIEGEKIIDLGSHIFSSGRSSAQERTLYKSKRVNRKRRKQRKKQLLRELKQINSIPDFNQDSYSLRSRGLEEKLELNELGRVLFHLNQRRGYKSNRKVATKEEDGIMLKSISSLKEELKEQTLGQYFNSIKSLDNKIRGTYTSREIILDEFHRILNFQSQFYPSLLNQETKERLQKIIFFQRPLKSKKNLKGKCTFEKRKYRAPKCFPLSQEYRMLCSLNTLKIWNSEGEIVEFERERILNFLEINKELILTKSSYKPGNEIELNKKVIELLGLQKGTYFCNIERLEGNRTNFELLKVLNPKDYSKKQIEKMIHSLLIFQDETLLRNYSQKEWNFNKETSEKFSKLQLESGYLNVSTRFVKRVIPYLIPGKIYSEAASLAGYNHSLPEEVQELDFLSIPPKTNNPVVNVALGQLEKQVNNLISKHGKPNRIVLEMNRDLKNSKKKREELQIQNFKNEKENKRITELLQTNFNLIQVSNQDIQKYKLWKEQWETCIYSGKQIPKEDLFNGNTEIDHILPSSRTLDNSFSNKTLTFRTENQQKGNRTPYEYLGESTELKERIKILPRNKQQRFFQKEIEQDFLNRQLNDTSYICREALKYLKQVCPKVTVSKGILTSELRSLWNLNTILNTENKKNRNDHRHHAVDAVVVSLTSPKVFRLRSGWNKSGKFPEPWKNFRQDVATATEKIIVSPRKRNKKQGKLHMETLYSQMKDKTGKPLVEKDEDKLEYNCYSIKKPLSWFENTKQLHKIIDNNIKEIIFKRLIEFGISEEDLRNKKSILIPKEAFKEDLRIPSKSGRFEPRIKSVKIKVRSRNMFEIKPGTWVECRNNYSYEIFEDSKGKKTGKIVTLFEASKKGFKENKDNNPNFRYSLQIGDLWNFGNSTELNTKDLWRVKKLTEGEIVFESCNLKDVLKRVVLTKLTGYPVDLNLLNFKKVGDE